MKANAYPSVATCDQLMGSWYAATSIPCSCEAAVARLGRIGVVCLCLLLASARSTCLECGSLTSERGGSPVCWAVGWAVGDAVGVADCCAAVVAMCDPPRIATATAAAAATRTTTTATETQRLRNRANLIKPDIMSR